MYFEQQKAAELETKILPQTKKADFEAFWSAQVEALRKVPLEYTREKLDLPYEIAKIISGLVDKIFRGIIWLVKTILRLVFSFVG